MATSLNRRVAITGCGIVGPFGLDVDSAWASLHQGAPFTARQWRGRTYLSGVSAQPDLRKALRSSQASRFQLVSQYALHAAHVSFQQSSINLAAQSAEAKIGLVFGTNNGPSKATQEIYDDLIGGGPSAVKPRVFQESVFNAPASHASIHFGIKGPILVAPTGLCAGVFALWQAQMLLAHRDIYTVVVICADEVCTALQFGLWSVGFLSPNDGKAQGGFPFDTRTNGALMSEGACALIIERFDEAEARGATILAELTGVGVANDAYRLAHNAPDGRGLRTAMEAALADAEDNGVDLVISGSSCTIPDEQLEEKALREVFGSQLPPVCSTKGAIGLAMGAAAMMDVCFGIEALRRRAIPATFGFANRRRDCSLDIQASGRDGCDLRTVMINSIGINGLYGSAIVRKAA